MPQRPRIHGKTCGGKRLSTYDSSRPCARKRGYTRRWERASKAYLREHPLCVKCLEDDRVESATVVDHIVPHRGDMKLFWDRSNWQAMCESCHNRKSRGERIWSD